MGTKKVVINQLGVWGSNLRDRRVVSISLAILGIGLFLWMAIPRVLYLAYQYQGGRQLEIVWNSIDEGKRFPAVCGLSERVTEQQREELVMAANRLERAIDLLPSAAGAYLQLGRVECLTGDFQSAVQSLNTYIQKKPKNQIGYLEAGFANENAGKTQTALSYWKLVPYISNLFFETGKEAQLTKNYQEALAWYKRSTLVRPGWNEPWYRSYLIYQDMGKYDEGLSILLEGANQSNEIIGLSNLYYCVGWIRQYNQKPSDPIGAWDAYTKALEVNDFSLNPSHQAASYSNRGFVLSSQGKIDGAIEQFEKALQLNPNLYWSYLGLARARWQKGDHTQAFDLANRAILLSAHPNDAYLTLGDFYRAEGNNNQAQVMYEKAIEISPNFESAQKALEELETTP